MRSVLGALLGVASGVAIAGCAALCADSSSLRAGVYVLDATRRNFDDFLADDYRLTVDDQHLHVVESYLVGGHRYELRYQAITPP